MADRSIPASTALPELAAVRARLDKVDLQLVQLLAARGQLIDEVIRTKRIHGVPVVDPLREEAMLAQIEVASDAEGLDPRVARAVLRSVIDAFTVTELEELDGSSD